MTDRVLPDITLYCPPEPQIQPQPKFKKHDRVRLRLSGLQYLQAYAYVISSVVDHDLYPPLTYTIELEGLGVYERVSEESLVLYPVSPESELWFRSVTGNGSDEF